MTTRRAVVRLSRTAVVESWPLAANGPFPTLTVRSLSIRSMSRASLLMLKPLRTKSPWRRAELFRAARYAFLSVSRASMSTSEVSAEEKRSAHSLPPKAARARGVKRPHTVAPSLTTSAAMNLSATVRASAALSARAVPANTPSVRTARAALVTRRPLMRLTLTGVLGHVNATQRRPAANAAAPPCDGWRT
jgi:hypothetical protein